MSEAFTSLSKMDVGGLPVFAVKLAKTFRNREAVSDHYIGQTVEIDGTSYLVKGVWSFARNGQFGSHDMIGFGVEPATEGK